MLIALIITEGASWWARLQPYLDYPGFEAWKFLNLTIFVVALVIVLRKFGLPDLFRERKKTIQLELERAQQERDAALAKLKEVEERLGRLDTEIAAIKELSKREAAEERERIANSTEVEIRKLSEQATREIESAGKVAKKELRRYTAEQSVRLAEELVRREMKPEDDARLIANNIEELGGPAQ
jgi:DNA phosphorothioation-dependent restriction protein DptG